MAKAFQGVLAMLILLAAFSGFPVRALGQEDIPVADAAEKDRPEKTQTALRINRIRIEGCDQVPRRNVRSILLQKKTPWYKIKLDEGFDQFWAENDRRRIELYYRSRGFYSAEVEGPEVELDKKARGVTITYRIREGSPVRVSSVDVIFEDGVYKERDSEDINQLLGFKQGDAFELEPYQETATAMENYYKDIGFYEVRVDRRALVDPDALTAQVTYRIRRNERFRYRAIIINGCDQTSPRVVEKALDLEPRDWYSRNEIILNQRRVQSLPIYRTVRMVEEPDPENRRIDLEIRVEEGKPREIKTGIGYGSEEGVRVQAQWRHVNFLGGARELVVSARWSELLEKEEITFSQPNLRLPGDFARLTAERRVEHEEAYTYEAVSLVPLYHFILTHYLWTEASYRIEQNQISRVENAIEIAEEDLAKEGLLSAALVRLDWTEIDDALSPRLGARASISVEVGGGPFGGDFDYTKIVGEARGYYPIFDPVVGAMRWKMGWAEPQGNFDRIPLFKRFYVGGTGSVRGFDRFDLGPKDTDGDPIGGARSWEASLEFRFPIWESLGGVVFSDNGWVWPEGQDYNSNDVLYSAGFGIRYNTPIGPLALDFAFPLTDDPDYPDFRVHFNIGNTF